MHTHLHTHLQRKHNYAVTYMYMYDIILHMCITYLTYLGRSSMKQYVPKKPVRRGFKVWVVADSENDYFLDVDVYVGRPSDGVRSEQGLGARVVLQLTEPYRHKNYHVFTSPTLFDELLQHGLYACGTVRIDCREFPDELKGVRLERGCHDFRQRGKLSAIIWQDKRQVSVLSTLTTPDETLPIRRKERDGTATTLPCPTAITTYNKYMAGVDKGDQLRRYYRLRLKFMIQIHFLHHAGHCHHKRTHTIQ